MENTDDQESLYYFSVELKRALKSWDKKIEQCEVPLILNIGQINKFFKRINYLV